MKKFWKILLALIPSVTLLFGCKKAPVEELEEFIPDEVPYQVFHDDEEDIDYTQCSVAVQHIALGKSVVVPGVYSDEIFFKESNVYHHFLAKQSLGLALSAFQLVGDTPAGDLSTYFTENSFDDVRIDDYFKETSLYTVGTCIGRKDIEKDGEKATLIVCAIRGGLYKKEWLSNLTVGYNFRHEGFNDAAQLVTDRVLSYIATQQDVDPNIKIWVTGFSRAGAIANLVAANLNKSILVTKDDVYAYTFAAPRPESEEIDQSEYDNIFNIMGASDFIPQFVPIDWNFEHYGHNLYLPGGEYDSTFAYKYKAIQDLLAEKGVTSYYNTNFNFRVRLLYGILLNICDGPDDFVELLEPVFLSVLNDKSPENLANLVREFLINWNKKDKELIKHKDELIDYAVKFLPPMITGKDYMEGQDNKLPNKIAQLAHEHFPEQYYYWLYNSTPEELYHDNDNFAYICLDGDVNYTLVDKDTNEVVLEIKKDKKVLSEYATNNHIDIDVFNIKDKVVMVLPFDKNYELTYKANRLTNFESLIVPYGRVFTNKLVKYENNKRLSANDEGMLISINSGVASYSIDDDLYNPIDFANYLGVGKGAFYYRTYIIMLVALLALGLCLTLIIGGAINALIKHKKPGRVALRMGVFSVYLISVIEGEVAYWLLADFPIFNIMFKAIAGILIIVSYILRKDLKKIKNPLDSLLPFLIAIVIANITVSIHVAIGIIIGMVALILLSLHFLRKKPLNKRLWILYGVFSVISVGIVMFMAKSFSFTAITCYVMVPVMLLATFAATLQEGRKEHSTYLITTAYVLLGLYLLSPVHLVTGVLYVVAINAGMMLFALSENDKDVVEAKEEVPLLEEVSN
ncbi:MAG: hypothetical protein IJ656_01675 [Bacilli bacterium]|nr:hypothetical protein [Bacilli bacterium]